MELDRAILVRLLVRGQRRQSGLRVRPSARADARLGADRRSLSVGSDNELGINASAGRECRADMSVPLRDIDEPFARKLYPVRATRDLGEAGDELVRFDIRAERGKPNIRGTKGEARDRHARAGRIDHLDRFDRRRHRAKLGPEVQRAQEAQRTFEQGDGAAVAREVERAAREHAEARLGERNRACKACGAGADNENIRVRRLRHRLSVARSARNRAVSRRYRAGAAARSSGSDPRSSPSTARPSRLYAPRRKAR